MIGPVNVLAVLELAVEREKAAGRAHVAQAAALAAFEELIEAAEQAHSFLCEKAPATATEYRLRKAIARVKGESA